MKPKWVKQDPSLIHSDICIRCGACCKATLNVHQPFPEDKEHKRQKIEYISTIFGDIDGIKVVDITNSASGKTRVMIRRVCPKLDTTEEGFKVCSIYNDRPVVCKSFNCIQTANHNEQAPENWDNIKKLIKQYPVEGVELLS